MSATLRIEAPTDEQLRYLAELCEQRGIIPRPVVYSRADATACITAILARQYDPAAFAPLHVEGVPFR